MDLLKSLFPFKAKVGDVMSLVIAIVIYVVIGAIAGVLLGLLSNIPVVGLLVGIVGTLVDIYCVGGIVVSILIFCKVIK